MDKAIAILERLEKNARATPAELAIMLNLPETEVTDTIRRLEAEGVIRGYRALVDWEKLGQERIYAMIEIRVRPEPDVGFDAVAKRISLFDEVHSLYLVSGQYDLAAVVTGRSLKDVAAFVAEKLAPLAGVESTATGFVLKRYKIEGENLIAEREDWRLPVAP